MTPNHAGSRCIWRLLIVVVAVTGLLLTQLPLRHVPVAEAHPSRDLPSPFAFALPSSSFPAGASLRGRRADERALQAASGLHTVPLARLGHLEGFLGTASWFPSSAAGTRQALTLQYMVSVFGTMDGAATAYADAQASLWETGYPVMATGVDNPTFMISERGRQRDAVLVLYQGTIEIEFRLRYSAALDRTAINSGLWYLRHAAHVEWRGATRIARSLSVTAGPSNSDPLPPIFAAPWGTGPVMKSPSLMVLDTAQVGAETHLDPGAARPAAGPALAARATNHPVLVLNDGLSRYVRTASVGRSEAWYNATTLYSGAQQAEAALVQTAHANRGRSGALPYTLDPAVWRVGRLSAVDDARAWRIHGETLIAVRLQNVVTVLAAVGRPPTDLIPLLGRLAATVPTWLHAQGTSIVTATGDPLRLASANWYGAEELDFVVGGLDFQPYQAILNRVKLLGFNSLRLPLSNQMVEQNPVVADHLAANPELKGLRALDILDRIIAYAGALGLSVILDNHRSEAGWSTQPDGLWYTAAYPDAAFVKDWVTLAQRYAGSTAVVGADLRNEPHGKVTWGDANPATDWHDAAQRAGNAVLTANPHLLIMVEGIQYYKNAASYWWGGSLMGVADSPVVLHFADGSPGRSQLVYSVHDYGPDLCGKGCPWFSKATTYADLTQIWEQYWGYITADPKQPYAAPIWVGEFGTCDYQRDCVVDTAPGSQGQWFSSLVRYIGEKRLGWGYWAINGTESTAGGRIYGKLDWYGFLDHTWTSPYPWLEEGLRSILTAPPSSRQSSLAGHQRHAAER